jgi:hypothetical protein
MAPMKTLIHLVFIISDPNAIGIPGHTMILRESEDSVVYMITHGCADWF